MSLPGDAAVQIFNRSCTVLRTLRLDGMELPGARWRIHPDCAAELKKLVSKTSTASGPVVVPVEAHHWTLWGFPLVEDAAMGLMELRFEVDA